jgi:hypothetical protein
VVRAEVDKLREEMRATNTVFVSPSTAEYYNLRVQGVTVEEFQAVPDGRSCLSQRDIESSFKYERELTEFLTPTLQELCSHGLDQIILVSSAHCPWKMD